MCGIYGIFNKEDYPYLSEFWDFKYRGPDFSAVPYVSELYHRVSSIIDC